MSRGEKIFGVVWSLLFGGFGLVIFVVGTVDVVRGFSAFDPSRSCSGSSACVTRVPATMASTDGEFRVAYGDGRHATIDPGTDDEPAWPEYGTDVVLERWHGLNVAVFDPATERLYKDSRWPARWDVDGITAMAFGVLWLGFTVGIAFSEALSGKQDAEAAG